MHLRARLLPLGLIASAASMLAATPAHAGLLIGSATNCGPQPDSQTFLPWADVAQYTPVSGGSFEAGAPSWSLSGGAQEVTGNETYYAGSSTDSQSLGLPAGSSATSPTTCVGIQNPDLRLFARNTGDPTSTLTVNVNYIDVFGNPASAAIGQLSATGAWTPTVQDPLLVNMLALLPGNETPVSFTFTPQGQGNWQIDDVYVDPFNRG
jgi:hypothetical protein